MTMLKPVYVMAAKRTAFGAFGGSLKSMSAVELGAAASKAAIAELGDGGAALIDACVMGNVAQTTTDVAYLGRHVALKAGVKEEAPGLTVNRLCGSGFQSIVSGCQDIFTGDAQVVLTGGAENMSLSPYLVHGIRFGNVPLGTNPPMVDSLWDTLRDHHIDCPMAITAENLAEEYGINKEASDALAARSQDLWDKANKAGVFKNEIVPIMLKDRKKGEYAFEVDEGPRPGTTAESLAKLKPLFKKDGVVSAGNASGISDGAGAVIIAGEDAVKGQLSHVAPMARIVSYAITGVPPRIMGAGPITAMRSALERAGLTFKDMDLIEINEAFAAQFLSCAKALEGDGFDMDKANLSGGAIALGHPTGASGSRIMGHLAHQLQQSSTAKYAIGSACIGGGQGIAIILEKC